MFHNLIGLNSVQQFIDLTAPEKNELFIRASALMGISPTLLEKDFWVSWILTHIFQLPFSNHLVFKGGTSLSKCYGLIQRFSEDCDITIDKALFSESMDDSSLSGKQFQRLLELADKQAIDFIQHTFTTSLENIIRESLPTEATWQLLPDEFEPKNLRFYYPVATSTHEHPYIKQSVLIELGIRGDIYPCEEKNVLSYVESKFLDLLSLKQTPIRTLLPIRTFWEKITLLHAENNRPEGKDLGDRLSRHYYDVYQLIQAHIDDDALINFDLLHDVIANKKKYFRASWANYDTAIPGQLRIYPHEKLLKELERDYKNMNLMIFGTVPSFEEILNSIQNFQTKINNTMG